MDHKIGGAPLVDGSNILTDIYKKFLTVKLHHLIVVDDGCVKRSPEA